MLHCEQRFVSIFARRSNTELSCTLHSSSPETCRLTIRRALEAQFDVQKQSRLPEPTSLGSAHHRACVASRSSRSLHEASEQREPSRNGRATCSTAPRSLVLWHSLCWGDLWSCAHRLPCRLLLRIAIVTKLQRVIPELTHMFYFEDLTFNTKHSPV